MTSAGNDGPTPLRNPFPSAAVARLSIDSVQSVSILTAATERAFSYVDAYIEAGNRPQGAASREGHGNILAIIGEYGTGKTHLALQLLRRLQGPSYTSLNSLYLDAPADTFLALYKERFFPKLLKANIKRQIAEYYADIVAEELASSELTEKIAQSLKSRDLPASEVIQRFGLMESEYLQKLKLRLKAVTEIEQFGIALTLLLRPEFEDAAWEWLSGGQPDQVLVERGIHNAIDSDAEALEAMGVIALLYGHQGHHFVVVIDELEKVLSRATDRPVEDATVLAFKKLLEVFGSTGAFLVLSGLPDFLEALPEDARQRIGCLVRPTALTAEDTIRYIQEVQRNALGESRLRPFNEDVVQYLVTLAGGNARKVVKLCYHAYQAAAAADTDVTRAMVRNAARDQFELVSTEGVQNVIARLLDSYGWRWEKNHDLKKGNKRVRLHYWVPTAGDTAGCAIIITKSILDTGSSDRLQAAAKLISDLSPVPVQKLVVVNGYLAENLRHRLNAFDNILVYDMQNFYDDLDSAIKGMRIRLESDVEENALLVIRERVEELARQSARVNSTLAQLYDSSNNVAQYERAAEAGLRRVFGKLASNAQDVSDDRIDPIFHFIESSLSWITEPVDKYIGTMFDVRSRSSSPDFHMFDMLERRDRIQMLEIPRFVMRVTRSFKDAVSYLLDHNPRPFEMRIELLGHLCRSYDDVTGRASRDSEWEPIFSASIDLRQAISERRIDEFEWQAKRSVDPGQFVAELQSLGERVYRQCGNYLDR